MTTEPWKIDQAHNWPMERETFELVLQEADKLQKSVIDATTNVRMRAAMLAALITPVVSAIAVGLIFQSDKISLEQIIMGFAAAISGVASILTATLILTPRSRALFGISPKILIDSKLLIHEYSVRDKQYWPFYLQVLESTQLSIDKELTLSSALGTRLYFAYGFAIAMVIALICAAAAPAAYYIPTWGLFLLGAFPSLRLIFSRF